MFRVLRQKSSELAALETQITAQTPPVEIAFSEGNTILSQMRALTVETGPVEARSVEFSEAAVRLQGLITQLRQLFVAQLVERAAQDLSASVVLLYRPSAMSRARWPPPARICPKTRHPNPGPISPN